MWYNVSSNINNHMEYFSLFLYNYANYFLFLDAVSLFILFYSFVAHTRQGFYGLDIRPLTYFTAFRFAAALTESIILNFGGDTYISIVVLWFILNLLSFAFLARFALLIKPISRNSALAIFSLFLLVTVFSFLNEGFGNMCLVVYSLLSTGTFLLLAFSTQYLGIKINNTLVRILSFGQVIVSFIYPAVFYYGYNYVFESSTIEPLSFAIFLRFLITMFLGIGMFGLYLREHQRLSSLPTRDVYLKKTFRKIVFLIAFIILIFFFIFSFFREREAPFRFESLSQRLGAVVIHIENSIRTAEGGAFSLSGSPVFDEGIIASPNLSSTLDRYAGIQDNLVVYVMDKEGNVIDSSNRSEKDSFVGKNYSNRPYFQKAIMGKHGEDYDYVAVGLTSEIAGYYVANPIFGKNFEVQGVIVTKLNLDIGAQPVYKSCYFIADLEGVIIESDCDKYRHLTLLPLTQELISQKIESGQHKKIINESVIPGFDSKFGEYDLYSYKKIAVLSQTVDEIVRVGVISEEGIDPVNSLSSILLSFLFVFFMLTVFFTSTLSHQAQEAVESRELMAQNSRKEAEVAKEQAEKEKKELEKLNRFMIGRELKMIELKEEIRRLEEKLKNK